MLSSENKDFLKLKEFCLVQLRIPITIYKEYSSHNKSNHSLRTYKYLYESDILMLESDHKTIW